MKRNTLTVHLTILVVVVSAILAISVTAQEFDEFVYLPVIIKSPPGCNSYEPNDTPGQANWIHDGETQRQCIIPETDVDWVKFSVGTTSKVSVGAADEGGDIELRLYSGDLNLLESDYGWPNDPAQINRDCGIGGDPLAAGVYYARVEHWLNSAEIPSYDITLTADVCPAPVVLANHSHYTTSYDSLIVVGEVQNSGEVGLSPVNVVANLFGSNGQLVDTGTNGVYLSVLPPGDKTCFTIGLDEPDGWSYYAFETPTYYSTSDDRLQNMTIYNDSGTYNPDGGSYRILGFVRNDNNARVRSIQPIVTLYNVSGTVIGCSYTFVNSTDLDPAQSSSFELTFSGYDRDYADVTAYRIQVDGDLQ